MRSGILVKVKQIMVFLSLSVFVLVCGCVGLSSSGVFAYQPALPAATIQGVTESRIKGAFSGWDGDTLFELTNGQIWQQAEYAYTYHYAYQPKVLIYRDGSYFMMKVEGVEKQIRVRAVTGFGAAATGSIGTSQSAMRSTIRGTFKGWSGDTLFELSNGQIWKQAEYAYVYHYAYMPEVLVYRSGAGFKMKVEGIADEIAVVRIR